MPILRGSVTFARFRVEHPDKRPNEVRGWISRGLKSGAFEPIDRRSDEDRSAGFAELESPESVEFSPSAVFQGDRVLFCWRVDQLRVRTAEVKAELERWMQAFEREEGRRPARGEKKDARAAIQQKLRSQATPVTKTHDVAWEVGTGQLQIWASSRKVVEEVAEALETAFKVKVVALGPSAFAHEQLRPTASLLGVEEVSLGQA